MCLELEIESISQRPALAGEKLVVRTMRRNNPGLIALVVPDNPFVAVHPPKGSVLRVLGIPENRQKAWGVGEVAEAISAPFDPEIHSTDYDALQFAGSPELVDLRACVCGMQIEVVSIPLAA